MSTVDLDRHKRPSCQARNQDAFQTRAVIEIMTLDSDSEFVHLKVDGGHDKHGPRDGGARGCGWVQGRAARDAREPVLESAPGVSAIGLFGWDIMRPETLVDINMTCSTVFVPCTSVEERSGM